MVRSADVPEELAQKARERVDEMPAESVTGQRDPQGGGEGDPADYRNVQNDDEAGS
jgi:nicotinamide mononucleotide (NMN) deamidase PncC